jgi:uncharacterized heparinase superfamily protein
MTLRLPRTPLLYYHTASQMDTQQLLGVAGRKLRATVLPRLSIDFDERYERRIPKSIRVRPTPFGENLATLRASLSEETRERARRRATDAADGTVAFLGRERRLAGPSVDWGHDALEDLPRLWRLNLYGFEPLSWHVVGFDEDDPDAVVPAESFDRWIRGWERTASLDEPDFLRRRWTPYAVSLRILHWTRYLAWRVGSDDTDASPPDVVDLLARQIYKNALFLQDHVERDVGGNHLVENGAALVVAGLLFEDDPGWTDTGLSLLEEVARTQFLSDGGHFERSPMYHVLTITRYLTVCDLLRTAGRTVPEEVERTAREGVEFLRNLRPPDGRIPLLNDSVFGQGLSLDACLRYAASVGVPGDAADDISGDDEPRRTDTWDTEGGVSDSGYRWLRSESGSMLVDGGPVGPPHLPGHSHNDTLSYLLWVDGQRLVTDTGVYDYESGERRRYSRGVAGHNTVQVGEAEPIDIGGRFLMGPRTDPETAHRRRSDGVELFEGAYEARPLDGPHYRHHRSIYAGEGWWLVWDDVSGTGGDPVRSRVHLHPSVDATADGDSDVRLARGDDAVARIRPLSADAVNVTDGEYFPRFGEAHDRFVVEIETTGDDVVSVGYLLTTDETVGDVAFRADDSDDDALPNRPVRLDVDDDNVELPRPSLLNGGGSR